MIGISRKPPARYLKNSSRRAKLFKLQTTQYKYALLLFRFGTGFGLFVTGVSLYLLNSNYFMFKNALLIHAPKVVYNLNSELKMANELILGALVTYGIFMALLGARLSQRIVMPIFLIQEKIKAISKGQLVNAKLVIRKTDEFQDFCDDYNSMIETLQDQLIQDLKRLEYLKPDPHNRDAVHAWEKMIQEKKKQLESTENSSSPDQAASLRHVS